MQQSEVGILNNSKQFVGDYCAGFSLSVVAKASNPLMSLLTELTKLTYKMCTAQGET